MKSMWFVDARAVVFYSAMSMVGCSNNFMPLTDERFILRGYEMVPPGMPLYKGMICAPDGSACGRRIVNEDLYDLDVVNFEYQGTVREVPFGGLGGQTDTIEIGYLSYVEMPPEIGHVDAFFLNDYPRIPFELAPAFQIFSPEPEGQVSLSLQSEGIRIEWTPGQSGFPMSWKFIHIDNEVEELPCDLLSWGQFEGEGEDTGVMTIPLDVIPPDLPPQGCEVSVSIARVKTIDLPAGVEHGRIESNRLDGVNFRIVP